MDQKSTHELASALQSRGVHHLREDRTPDELTVVVGLIRP
jgi:hypothetical protein